MTVRAVLNLKKANIYIVKVEGEKFKLRAHLHLKGLARRACCFLNFV